MGKPVAFVKDFIGNNLRFCEFAITNICTAKCQFCSIWQQKEKITVATEKALETISHLSSLGVRFITLTGGEPLLHPDFEKMIMRCTEENVVSAILAADTRILTDRRIEALERSSADIVCISVDHHTEEVAFKSRSIPDLLAHTERAVRKLKDRKIKTMASTLICNFNHRSLKQLFEKCTEIGFDFITVNYPEFSESPVYTLGGEAISLTKDDIIRALEEVIVLRKKYSIVNTEKSIRNIIAYLKGERPNYLCLGGYRVFFVDWFFKAYPCMHLAGGMGDVLQLEKEKFRKVMCNSCNMSWYRDFSIYFHGIKSIKPILSGLRFVFSDIFN